METIHKIMYDCDDGKYYGTVVVHYIADAPVRVDVAWPVDRASREFFMEMLAQAGEMLGGVIAVGSVDASGSQRWGRYKFPDRFKELSVHAPGGRALLLPGSLDGLWEPSEGYFGIEAQTDVSDVVDRMFAATGMHYTLRLATLFARYAGQVQPYAAPRVTDHTRSPAA